MVVAVTAWFSLALALAATILGLFRPRWYWLAGFCMYVFSFLTGFSIGLYTLSFTFVLWALAIGHSLRWIQSFLHSLVTVVVGLIAWKVSTLLVDDYWLFLPIGWVFRLIFS